MKRMICLLFGSCFLLTALCGCTVNPPADVSSTHAPLPPPSVGEDQFGVDKNININTIDGYLDREDVAYRDVRMLFDPADYAAIGGEADLTRTIRGFKVTPYPYIATLSPLPVEGAYDGPCLYALTWNPDGRIQTAVPRYEESLLILGELFPRDKAIFLMCGGGGYADMMRSLLLFLGWDGGKLYNVGANWGYQGEHRLELVIQPEDAADTPVYATWRADYATIDFSRLHPVAP